MQRSGSAIGQVVNGVPITYTLDLAAPSVTVLAQQQLNNRTTYLYGQGDSPLAGDDGAAWTYLSGRDALNSVRQETDAEGRVLAARSFDPYGVPLSGDGGEPFGYTGEYRDEASGLVFLRARYLQVEWGAFLSRDPRTGEPESPTTVTQWNYAGDNPINYVDPTGEWRWAITPSLYHWFIENYYEMSGFWPSLNSGKHLEYRIPTSRDRVDMFNSRSGDVYEIEPWYKEADGVKQVLRYVPQLNRAASLDLLQGRYLLTGQRYHWRAQGVAFVPGTGADWPGKYRRSMTGVPGFQYVDLVADYVGQGVVVYWLESRLPDGVPWPLLIRPTVPNERLMRPRDWVPGQPVPQPVPVWTTKQACVATLLVGTIAADVLTGGLSLADDPATIGVSLAALTAGP